MAALITKVYDVPVDHIWYEVKLELDRKTADRKIIVELKEVFCQSGEGEFSCTNIPIGEMGRTKNLKIIIDTNLQNQYEFILSVDGIDLGDYINEYKNRYATWVIEKLGSKSKLTFDEQENTVYFKRQKIQLETSQPTFEKTIWNGKFKEEYGFQIVRTLEGMGELSTVLYVNGERNDATIKPRFEADA